MEIILNIIVQKMPTTEKYKHNTYLLIYIINNNKFKVCVLYFRLCRI